MNILNEPNREEEETSDESVFEYLKTLSDYYTAKEVDEIVRKIRKNSEKQR